MHRFGTIDVELSANPDRLTQYGVWAPRATGAALHVEGEDAIELTSAAGGWWVTDRAQKPGERYRYSVTTLDEQEQEHVVGPYPDPRSRLQPEGIHGPSQVTDGTPVSLEGYKGRPLRGQVIYELHVGTFSEAGTFAGVVEGLDYLERLGVTAIELMPVNPVGGDRNWGYDGVDWLAVHQPYGGPEELKKLVMAAHDRGIAMILDVVFNHFGPDGNYVGAFGPYTQAGNTGWGDVINLSGNGSNEVRALILDACRQWLGEFGFDGLRLDAIHAYDDRSAYSIMEQIHEVAADVEKQTGVPRFVIAESDLNDPAVMVRHRMDAQWVDDIHHSIHVLTSGERQGYFRNYAEAGIEGLAKSLAGMYFFDGTYSDFRGRNHGRPLPEGVEPWQGVTYTTTHDQTGNRAMGDRPSMNLDDPQLLLRAATVLASPYTPMLFQGEEYAAKHPFPFFCSHEDAELNRLTYEGRKHEFAYHGWETFDTPEPSAKATFESAKLHREENDVYHEYQRLIAERERYGFADTDYADFHVTCGTDDEPWLIMEHPKAYFVGNYGEKPLTVMVGSQEVELPAWGYQIVPR